MCILIEDSWNIESNFLLVFCNMWFRLRTVQKIWPPSGMEWEEEGCLRDTENDLENFQAFLDP